MKFEVNVEAFRKAIKPAVEVATRNVPSDAKFANLITIKAEKDRIILFAYSGRASIISPISGSNCDSLDYECKSDGKATVYGEDLFKFTNSFSSCKSVEFSLESNQLKIIPIVETKDKSKNKVLKMSSRSMPVVSETVVPPNIGREFSKESVIDREAFVVGMKDILFAPAFEEKYIMYMCMLLEIATKGTKDILRFSAGSGGRFAIKSVEGEHLVKGDKDLRVILPQINHQTIFKLLSEASCEEVTIKTVKANAKDDIPQQIMIEFDEMIMCVFGLEYFTKYPNLVDILDYQYPNRIYTELEEWKDAVATIGGTYRQHDADIHNTEIVFDTDNEVFVVTPQTAYLSPSAVGIVDEDHSITKGEKIWFRCNSEYLFEMMVQGGKKGRVQLNFDSQSVLDSIKDDKLKQMKPVLIKFQTIENEVKNTSENFYIFFTVSTK